ncbi:cytosine deaminase [Jannaschia aquimarina]|uniref:CodA_1 protein n=1 Tax=Jannaschia aquimarina TaxID=935700 RepID=A0A0D1D476_9RHOB|nr:cytosine deaminase [Jannaschia aquimarina]KIT14853.1 Cytosine deaminase [Jannaschia aquimarina]SNS57594.1 cytosine deaminase [Jannaschia aquimarina]
MDFRALPSGPITLSDVTIPACLAGRTGGLIRTDLHLRDGRLSKEPGETVAMDGAMVLPCFTDMHTHLDKGHIWPRASNPDGTFMGALETVRADHANWSADDLAPRMEFSLTCAHAHGTRAIRTHLDSMNGQDAISWPVWAEMRDRWAGRIEMQAVCLVPIDAVDDAFAGTADIVGEHGGLLGAVTYPVDDLRPRLRLFFEMASARGLSADFHVDETLDPTSETLRAIAETVIETGFDAPVVVGHCCSLSSQDEARALDTLDLVARAGLNVVSLPMCNLYLQDRQAGRTPRMRGITLVHEMRERGIPVAFASDNTRDPFYAYGDMDMLEVWREATRIGHLDHARDDWVTSVTTEPSAICGFGRSDLSPGAPADLVIFRVRTWTELLARPQSDRIVLRDGIAIDRTLPDYRDLDRMVSP